MTLVQIGYVAPDREARTIAIDASSIRYVEPGVEVGSDTLPATEFAETVRDLLRAGF